MLHPLWHRVEPIVAELDRNPLYRASGAAMELFHSNVLAWALRSHPVASEPLVQLLGCTPKDEYDVRREWRHLDLAIGVGSAEPGAVIENKITAMPDELQLERYLADVQKADPPFAEGASFVLLSLMPPLFDLPKPWRRVDYGELSQAMLGVADQLPVGFDADFTRRYARLAELLAQLGSAAGLGADPAESYYLDVDTEELLRQAGVRDLVLKLRNVDLVQHVREHAAHGAAGWHEATWSQGRAIAAWFTPDEEPPGLGKVHLGWQLQGAQLRIVALMRSDDLYGKGRKRDREEAAHRYLGAWFEQDVRSIAPGWIATYTGKLPYNHFDPDFIYRYGKVDPAIPSEELVTALARLSRAAEVQLSGLRGDPHRRTEGTGLWN